MNQAIKDLCEKSQDAEKGIIEVRPAISFVSDASYHDSSKNKSKFIEMMCRYNPTNRDAKADNNQVDVRKFDQRTSDDSVQEVCSKIPGQLSQYESTQAQ